ncbi:MAG: helix-hairpin-helix domain-containing protein [Gloeomargarita sp. SKYBB_i_bin120]|nr:helix-hairpin-helix domain-containing protein [Gloeomargarita sp. SKYG98]MCS7292307.1 helix-hairpin-helix domain-containing protein [Gloeomargarita sp. SKYB120]MDW8177867.1 helix-hairpin-helix domain-containing protein [Gloeomargarita sp. SKYBB_i_bin120]
MWQGRDDWFQRYPTWVYLSFIPWVGGIAQIWAGWVIRNYRLLGAGLAFTLVPLVLTDLLPLAWLGQIVLAFVYRTEFLVRTYPQHLPPPADPKLAAKILALRGKFDINTCSKEVLVHQLGLPIAYANDIIAMRESGHQFTHPEELTEIVGIPEATVQRIAPYLTFSYDIRQESYVSWRRANHFDAERLVAVGLEPDVAAQIVAERNRRGPYRSVVDIVKRTGLSTHQLRALL